ncbi:MAG: UDP-2,3-diacylglucosamine diphosphatase [Sinobacteraceae bacterium]|nr:UDP-2,3-diacylglucosamine diphosphatase [Nevskiaceae bacterium]
MAEANSRSRPVLLLSDLHLSAEATELRKGFLAFLAGPARSAQAVYILGDLFHAWAGDDLGLIDFKAEYQALKELTSSGVPVSFMHGNRDFLIGSRWAAATGVRILPDPFIAKLPDGPALLSHGDILCTDDRAYLRYRRVVRNRVVQWLFLHLSVRLRRAITHRLRSGSTARQQQVGAGTISDVNAAAVRAALLDHQQTRLIHGHTHRPARHDIALPNVNGCRIVLADWRPSRMEYLLCDAQGCHRVSLNLHPPTPEQGSPA